MPRGQKNKHRAHGKRHQVQGDSHALEGAQAPAAKEEGSSPSSSPPREASPYLAAYLFSLGPHRLPPIPTVGADASGTGADESAQGQDDSASSSGGPQRDPLIKRMSFLLQFLLHKYKLREPITKAEMMKVINKKYKERFPEILQRATEHMELVFGLDLKEVDPESQSYVLTSTVEFSREENLSSGTFPKYGLLMPLLGMMHLSDNQASEEEVWEFLNRLGVYDGKRHFIFGEARKLLTKDLVQEKYLEYRQVPGSHPPCYEFLWGPRAYTEACKTKVLKFLTKLNDVDQNAFQTLYLETWRDEEEREAGTGWPGVGMNARARARFRAKSSKASHSRRV